mgnify:FL=1
MNHLSIIRQLSQEALQKRLEWLPSIMRRILRMAARRISVYRAD